MNNAKKVIKIYSKEEIEILRQGGKALAQIIGKLEEEVRLGITTEYLDKFARNLIRSFGVDPSDEYSVMFSTSVNEEIAHIYPSERELNEGDVLSLDLIIKFRGYYTDMAVTVPVGKIDEKTNKLLKVTKKALELGIRQARLGNHIGDIGYAIQKHVEKNDFSVIYELDGHGIGKNVHEEPRVPNRGLSGEGPELKQGMVLAIEPLVAAGDGASELIGTQKGFAFKTADNSLSCHFEHTIVITKKGPEILTK